MTGNVERRGVKARWMRRAGMAAAVLAGAAGMTGETVMAQGVGYWHTSGNKILDQNGAAVRIAGINWYGFETTRAVPGGLTSQDYKAILQTIKTQGYNTVRIPMSNQMVETPGVPSSIGYSNNGGAINGNLQGLNSLQILDAIVQQAGSLGLKVILDNHRSEAGDSAESNGLWYTGSYPESAWINDWTMLASRYAGNSTVIGFDLRNEPHNATSGGSCWDCGGSNDWHLAAQRAGNAVLAVNPKLLIFVEGTDAYNNDWTWWGGNLEGVQNSPVVLNTPNQLVYSAHDYGPTEYQQSWFNGSTTPQSLAGVFSQHWGYVAKNGIAPVWLGEFGTTNDAAAAQDTGAGSQGQWFTSLVNYMKADGTMNWTYWALNGEDRYGLLDSNYDATPVSGTKQSLLQSIQSSSTATGQQPQASAPAAPGNLQAVTASTTQVNLNWTASATSGVTYTVYYGTSPNAATTTVAYGLQPTSFTVAALNPGTTYYFAVSATNSAGTSASSNVASATTQQTQQTSQPTQPTNGGGGSTGTGGGTPTGSGGGGCHVSYTDQNDWGSGFTGGVSFTSATALNSWTLSWTYAGNQQLSQSWNSNLAQSGQTVMLSNASWNGSVSAGGTVSGMGFNANYSGANQAPVQFYLNGVLCN